MRDRRMETERGSGRGAGGERTARPQQAARAAIAGAVLACAILLAPAGPARAGLFDGGEAGGSLTGSHQLQVWAEDSSRAASYLDRFDLQYERGPWAVGARLEFDEESRTDPEHFQGIARRFVEYRGETATMRAGTFYATFGRGLLLRAEEDDAVRVDRDIDGVHGSLAWRAFDGQAFIGRPRNDETHERDDLLSGAEAGVRLLSGLRLGAGYVRMDADPPDFAGTLSGNRELTAGSPAEELVGGNLRFQRGILDATLEGAKRYVWGVRDPYAGWIGTRGRDGDALYGSVSLGVPGYTLLLEGKDYEKFDAPYSTLPPANQAGIPINNGLDERGVGAVATVSPVREWIGEAAASWAEGRDDPGERRSVQGSVRRDWLGRAALELGGEWTEEEELSSHAYRRYYGPTIEALHYFGGSSISLHGRVQSWINQIRGGRRDKYTEIGADVTFALDPARAATLAVTSASEAIEEYDGEDLWISLELAWTFAQSHDLKLKVGEERGGIVCSGGICHYEPPFSGVRLELSSRL